MRAAYLAALAAVAAMATGAAAHAAEPVPAPAAPAVPAPGSMLARALAGPMAGVEEIVFAVRPVGHDGHWYANFSYYARDENRKTYLDGGQLSRLNLRTGRVTRLLDDPKGNVRDPCVSYDGKRILFSYRKGGTDTYHLWEIGADGSGLRQLTDGPYDDIEPIYLPDGDILFGSARCRRWVNCWLTQVANLHRADADGEHIRMISSNNDHDNTPWVMSDGRILYMRWEYVDRSQVEFHHLWTANPDGSSQMVYFGNMHPTIVMLDAKPIPGTDRVVSIFSPGHGIREHLGDVTIVDPNVGPDDLARARCVAGGNRWRDPYPFSEDCFLVASGRTIQLLDGSGKAEKVYELGPGDLPNGEAHEPRPLAPRPCEPVIASRVNLATDTGCLVLADVTRGRNMDGVRPGEIRKLLVFEQLPMPVHFSGGMEPISMGGTFTLPRLLGTVPVESDGSAHFEVPAMRSLFFVAMDDADRSVKRMQSFVTVQPGETLGCVGCHENRTEAAPFRGNLAAMRRPASRIEPVRGVPDVFDFPRDIQPILDRHCLKCHDYDKRSGGVILSGDRGPIYSHSYVNLTGKGQMADGRNARGNRPPRSMGAAVSPLMKKIGGGHHDVQVSDEERRIILYWIEAGANYPGTYAAVGSGMIGGYDENSADRSDAKWPAVQAAAEAMGRRCGECHKDKNRLPLSPSDDAHGMRHWAYNLTRTEKSLLLLAALPTKAGGYGICRDKAQTPHAGDAAPGILTGPDDADYQKIFASIVEAKRVLDDIKRFDMPGFRPNDAYVREMKRYGILPADLAPDAPIDPYATDRAYWQSFWYKPVKP